MIHFTRPPIRLEGLTYIWIPKRDVIVALCGPTSSERTRHCKVTSKVRGSISPRSSQHSTAFFFFVSLRPRATSPTTPKTLRHRPSHLSLAQLSPAVRKISISQFSNVLSWLLQCQFRTGKNVSRAMHKTSVLALLFLSKYLPGWAGLGSG